MRTWKLELQRVGVSYYPPEVRYITARNLSAAFEDAEWVTMFAMCRGRLTLCR